MTWRIVTADASARGGAAPFPATCAQLSTQPAFTVAVRSRVHAREPVEWPAPGVDDRQDEDVLLVRFERDHIGEPLMVALRINRPAARVRDHAG